MIPELGNTVTLPLSSKGQERLVLLGSWSIAAIVTVIFLWIVGDIFRHGVGGVNWGFVSSQPSDAGRAGGILPIIVSTMSILLVALTAAIPLSIVTAAWLAEFARRDKWSTAMVGGSLDVLAGVPSIVFGLFGNALFCRRLNMGYSIAAGGLTLACMVLPILIRSLEAAFRAVPDDYRLAAAALGLSRTRAVTSVLFPAALPGLAVGLILGIGRVLAETAALLFTSGYVDRMPRSVMDSGRSLSIHIYDLSMNVSGGESNAYATSVVLVSLLVAINWSVIKLSDRWANRYLGTV